MARYLVVTWDGAGNLVSTLGIAGRLADRGHAVRMLGHRSIDKRCGAGGWHFRGFEHTVDFDSTGVMDQESEMAVLTRDVWFNGSVGRDVQGELAREPADVLVVDCMLAVGLCAGLAAGVPTVALFHSPISGFRGGPMLELMAPAFPAVNAARGELGLPPAGRLADIHDACALSIVATPKEFDVDLPLPPNVRFVGPILDGPRLMAKVEELAIDDDATPLIVVSLSTGHQAQIPVLQRLIDALGDLPARVVVTSGPSVAPDALRPRGNTTVVRFVPHDRLLPRASLVITHSGLGTVMNALRHGVPLLCVPMGRDQFFNASRVEAVGAGRVVAADASPAAIVDAVRALLAEGASEREGAKRMARVIAGYRGAVDAVDHLERLAASAPL